MPKYVWKCVTCCLCVGFARHDVVKAERGGASDDRQTSPGRAYAWNLKIPHNRLESGRFYFSGVRPNIEHCKHQFFCFWV